MIHVRDWNGPALFLSSQRLKLVRGAQHQRRMIVSKCGIWRWRSAVVGHQRRFGRATVAAAVPPIATKSVRAPNAVQGHNQTTGGAANTAHAVRQHCTREKDTDLLVRSTPYESQRDGDQSVAESADCVPTAHVPDENRSG